MDKIYLEVVIYHFQRVFLYNFLLMLQRELLKYASIYRYKVA